MPITKIGELKVIYRSSPDLWAYMKGWIGEVSNSLIGSLEAIIV